ncbi:hypothetical protein RI129_005624 [Pyrocoelia pectoralis]|uniref:DUF229 domain containing protein n=1 Tax=Pyrocoelia pectoralis TaxID=417401 RepID=A0AAN7VHM6_9COLE
MLKKHFMGYRKYVYFLFLLILSLICLFYLQPPLKSSSPVVLAQLEYSIKADLKRLLLNSTAQKNYTDNPDENYLVHSSKCKIPSLEPFNMEILSYYNPKAYIRCSNKPLLTYIEKKDNVASLHVNQTVEKEYTGDNLQCCYKSVASSLSPKTIDLVIKVSKCIDFKNSVRLEDDVVVVWCRNTRKDQVVYKNVHFVVTITDEIKTKLQKSENETHLSVALVGIDSVSRLNMIRSLPYTYNYLQENDWIEFRGYNKIGDNTFPNIMGVLTGMNVSTTFKECNPKVSGQLDKCDLLWYDYKKLGFVTAYAEDETEISTFNYLKKGFERKPTDYYFRPYMLAAEKNLKTLVLEGVKYCTGPESAGERIMNLARDFTLTFRKYSNFGFFWMNSFSHNEINSVSRMDLKVAEFLRSLNRSGIFDNSIVIFFSDHGIRFGTVTYTHAGWLEERLPFFYMTVPKWFQKKFPRKYSNLVLNSNRLITPYDLYMTLQEILVLSGKKYSMKASTACPECKSLFEVAKSDRSCEDAGIENHWCTCRGYTTIPSNGMIVEQAAKFILREVQRMANDGGCVQFEVKNIISAGVSDNCDIKNRSHFYFLITFETRPQAVFQGTVSIGVDVPIFKMEGSVSRLDIYSFNSWCVTDPIVKKYCYCHGSFAYISSMINTVATGILQFFY